MKRLFPLFLAACIICAALTAPPASRAAETETDNTVRTEDLQYEAKALATHIAVMVAGDSAMPFMKWQPAGPVRYFIFGIKEPFLGAFQAVIDSYGRRLGMTFERAAQPAGSQMLFFYLKDLREMLGIPNLARFFGGASDEQQAAFRDVLETQKPLLISGLGTDITEQNIMVPQFFRIARGVGELPSANALVQAFAIDVYMALTLRTKPVDAVKTSFYANLERIGDLAPRGPEYAWRVPPVDLLYLDALYQPDVESGMLNHEAATLINELIIEDLGASRQLAPFGRYRP